MSRPIRMDDRYCGSTAMPKKTTKPKKRDVSHLHKYTNPGDAQGNGMYIIYANTKAELIQKMIEHDGRSFEPKYTGTMVPHSQGVIEQQGGYIVDGEPTL